MEWKEIAKFNGLYLVSNTGLIKHRDSLTLRKPILIKNKGYYRIPIKYNGAMIDSCVHREVAIAFVPNPDNKSQVNHKDAVKTNNSASNLEWVTPQENMDHAVKLGLLKYKHRKIKGKLSEEIAIEIRNSYVRNSKEFGTTALAHKYNVDPVSIWKVIKEKSYKRIA